MHAGAASEAPYGPVIGSPASTWAACSRTRSSGSPARASATSATSSAGTWSQLESARRATRRWSGSGLRSKASAASTSGFPAPGASPSSRSRSRRRQRLAQDQLRELDPPPPLHLRQQGEPVAERVVADGRQRDGGVERELLVAGDDAEAVGVLRPAEPAHQGHRVLDLVAVPRAQEDVVELRVEAVGVRRRIGAQAIAQCIDAAAHVALAEELAHPLVPRRGRLRGELHERGVDALDRSLGRSRITGRRQRSPRRRAAGGRPPSGRRRPGARARRCARRSRRVRGGCGAGG